MKHRPNTEPKRELGHPTHLDIEQLEVILLRHGMAYTGEIPPKESMALIKEAKAAIKTLIIEARIKQLQAVNDVIYDPEGYVFKTSAGVLKDWVDSELAALQATQQQEKE